MKPGVSLYSFHKYAAEREAGVKDCIKKAHEMGFEGLDFVEELPLLHLRGKFIFGFWQTERMFILN